MKTIFLILLIVMPDATLLNTRTDSVRHDYEKILRSVLKNIKESKIDSLEYCIPGTRSEAILYFSCDYDKDLSSAFQSLQQNLVDSSIKGDAGLLTRYLYLSEFVDGYFAEDYLINIDKIGRSNPGLLCSTLANCDESKIRRLATAKSNYCK